MRCNFLILGFLLSVAWPALAEKLVFELDGARVPLMIDTGKGVLYAGDSCDPLLYLNEVSAKQGKSAQTRTFVVNIAKVRAAAKGSPPVRVPSAFEIAGSEVKVLTENLAGASYATGKVVPRSLIATRMPMLCKD
jgi:hypothetical protein